MIHNYQPYWTVSHFVPFSWMAQCPRLLTWSLCSGACLSVPVRLTKFNVQLDPFTHTPNSFCHSPAIKPPFIPIHVHVRLRSPRPIPHPLCHITSPAMMWHDKCVSVCTLLHNDIEQLCKQSPGAQMWGAL